MIRLGRWATLFWLFAVIGTHSTFKVESAAASPLGPNLAPSPEGPPPQENTKISVMPEVVPSVESPTADKKSAVPLEPAIESLGELREPATKTKELGPVHVDRIEGKTIYLAGKSSDFGLLDPIRTKLEDLSLLGTLRAELHPTFRKGDNPKGVDLPFFLLSGLACAGCTNKFVFLLRADGKQSRKLVFPGRIRNHRNNRLVFESRAFYGKCLSGYSDIYVIFQNEKIKRRRFLQPSVYIFQPVNGRLEEKLVVNRRPGIHQVLGRVRNKSCFEIQGFDRKSERFDLKQLPFDRPELSSRYQKK